MYLKLTFAVGAILPKVWDFFPPSAKLRTDVDRETF